MKLNIKYRLIPFLGASVFIFLFFRCQTTDIQSMDDNASFIKFFGGIKDQQGFDIQQTNDGGYILFGSTSSFGNGGNDMYIIKVNEDGLEEWSNTYGGAFDDYGKSITKTNDNGYAIIGDFGYADGSSDMYFLKLDEEGNVEFEQTFGNDTANSDEHGNEVKNTLDGGYILVGSTSNPDRPETGPLDFYLVKTDASGNLQWQRTRGFENSEEIGNSVVQIDSDNYIVIGTTENARESTDQEGRNIFAYKINANGDNLANRFFGGLGDDIGSKILKTNAGYGIFGTSNSQLGDGGGNNDMILIQVDANLNALSTKTYGGPQNEKGLGISTLPDGGIIMVGSSDSFSDGNTNVDIYLLRTDFTGEAEIDWLIEPRIFGGQGADEGRAVIQTSDGFAIIGTTTFFEATDNRMLNLIKTNPNGQLFK